MLQSDGIEPEFGCIILTLDMNMWWLLGIICSSVPRLLLYLPPLPYRAEIAPTIAKVV
jgi:hypothetical protein